MSINKQYYPLIIAVLITVGLYSLAQYKKIQRNTKPQFTCGTIIDFGETSRGNRVVNYLYYVHQYPYKGSYSALGLFPDCEQTKYCIGKHFVIKYYSKNPDNSEILLNHPCDNDTTK